MVQIFYPTTDNIYKKDNEFLSAIRYGAPLTLCELHALKTKYHNPTISDYDKYINEIWEFVGTYGTDVSRRIWIQHLRCDNTYRIFTCIKNGSNLIIKNFIKELLDENNSTR